MLKYLKQYRFYITLFLFLLIPIIAIDTSTRAPRDYRFYDRVFTYITFPIQVGIRWSLETVVSFYQDYIFLWNTRGENKDLVQENRKLLNLIVNLKETQKENQRLRNLLDFKEKFELQAVVARVIATDVSNEFRVIRINRGEKSGITENMPVLNNEGVVGRILRTTANTADVLTILDLLSAVDAIVRRSRVRGIVEGRSDQSCRLKYALRTDDIRSGDRLVASGLGGVFPKGVSVGSVVDVNRQPYGITQEVEVEPSVDFSRLEEVLVLTKKVAAPMHITTEDIVPTIAPGIPKKTAPTPTLQTPPRAETETPPEAAPAASPEVSAAESST